MKTVGRAKIKNVSSLVERSTDEQVCKVDHSSEISDINLYKTAKLFAELKRIAGYKNVSITDEYKLLSEETRKK